MFLRRIPKVIHVTDLKQIPDDMEQVHHNCPLMDCPDRDTKKCCECKYYPSWRVKNG